MYQNILYLKLILLSLLLVGVSSCQFLDKIGKPPVPLDWPDGDIVFASNRITPNRNIEGWDGPLYFASIDSRKWAPIQNSHSSFRLGYTPAWSPDGQVLAFVDYPRELSGQIGTVLLDVQGERNILGNNSRVAANWSPDGRHLAYYGMRKDEYGLYISRPDGSEEQEIITELPEELFGKPNLVQDVRIAWSPDGQYISYDSFNAVGDEVIWIVPSVGGEPHQLVAGSHPAWSPLGDEIAFDRDGDIWIVNIEKGEERKLADEPDPGWHSSGWPTWSPDGAQLAFVNTSEGNAEIYRIRRDGSVLENLTNHPSHDVFPVWRPKESVD